MYSLRQCAAMVWGKVRRAVLIALRKKRVIEKLDRRRGACTRCGACCKILFKCPAYDDADGVPKCLIYKDRPGVCGLFPLDEKDLRDRDFVMPDKKCGFFFSDDPAGGNGNGNGRGNPGALREAMPAPIRWGPPGTNGGVKMGHGTLSILLALLRRPGGNGNGHANGNGNGKGNGSGIRGHGP